MCSFISVLHSECDEISCFKFLLPRPLHMMDCYLKLWAKIDPSSHKLFFPGSRAYPGALFLKFHLPWFLAQVFSLSWSSSGRLGWLATEHQGYAHLDLTSTRIMSVCIVSGSFVWILRTELASSYLQDEHFADCTISTDADLISDFPSHWFQSGLLCNWWNECQLPSI